MTRRSRIVFPGYPHHVTQRGNRRQDVFHDDRDRRLFLELLATYTKRDLLDVWSYNLMTNHIHLIAVPQEMESLSTAMRDLLSDYALHYNKRYGHKGHLWQERFYSSVLGPDHLWNAVRYVERNPVRAGMVARAEHYPWSSAVYHCGLRETDPVVSPHSPLIGTIPDWAEWLHTPEEKDEFGLLRRNTRTGYPTAPKEFIETLERVLGRPIIKRRHGQISGDGEQAPDWPNAASL